MSNLTNLVTEQFNELNTSYDNQKKQTKEKFIHKQQECEGEHKETIAQLNIELKSNEAQLLNLIRTIENKRGSMVTVEELASVLTLIADPINPTLENDVDVNLSEKSSSKTKKATSSSYKEKAKDITKPKAKSNDIATSKDKSKDTIASKNIIISKDSTSTSTSMPKPAPKYKGRYYR